MEELGREVYVLSSLGVGGEYGNYGPVRCISRQGSCKEFGLILRTVEN